MARYDYKCTGDCGRTDEISHGMNESPEVGCPTCGGVMEKVVGQAFGGVVYKTNGFYTTDHKHVVKTQGDTY